jgi:hypothetical protein
MRKKGKQKKIAQKKFKKSSGYLRKGAKSPDKAK